ncbi:hypothetical protein [Actibacterium pelagium]|uniref:Cation transport ATPase n=1 Tax=Actibacterium pelagium TaxID=2029103 RepID=A0A917ELM1_9RHOB|nr:hypothetical protein [Actibacterium pelagium]GGE52721.1 hypothetical protein GCM10011517_20620 [Actibacterium pelagium]
MSTWTFKKLAGLALTLALPACVASDGAVVSRSLPRAVSVTDANVVVTGPSGYCIDQRSVTEQDQGSFVLLASCDSLARGRRVQNQSEPLLLTASVSGVPGVVGDASVLKQFFTSEQGRQALSRDGRASTVEVLHMFRRDEAFILHARDTSSGLGDGLSEDYWRAFIEVKNHIVTASAIPFQSAPVSDDEALSVLSAFLKRIRGASGAAAN